VRWGSPPKVVQLPRPYWAGESRGKAINTGSNFAIFISGVGEYPRLPVMSNQHLADLSGPTTRGWCGMQFVHAEGVQKRSLKFHFYLDGESEIEYARQS
jgi:hypothetical protein